MSQYYKWFYKKRDFSMFSLFFPFMELAVLAVNFVELSPSHKSEILGLGNFENISSLSKIKV